MILIDESAIKWSVFFFAVIGINILFWIQQTELLHTEGIQFNSIHFTFCVYEATSSQMVCSVSLVQSKKVEESSRENWMCLIKLERTLMRWRYDGFYLIVDFAFLVRFLGPQSKGPCAFLCSCVGWAIFVVMRREGKKCDSNDRNQETERTALRAYQIRSNRCVVRRPKQSFAHTKWIQPLSHRPSVMVFVVICLGSQHLNEGADGRVA